VRLIPRDEQFFNLFAQIAQRITASAQTLAQLFAEPAKLENHVAAIKALEHEADEITHQVILRLNKSFITPLDREDIHLLASRLDTVVDLIDGAARRAAMFRIREVREPARQLADVFVRAGTSIAKGVAGMRDYKTVASAAREIKQLEEEGDALYQQAVGRLFAETKDAIEVMKWKDLYDVLETALDECEDVANTLESIALKNS
jgi:predicted phosphate transport protein (TIGR00153 family)